MTASRRTACLTLLAALAATGACTRAGQQRPPAPSAFLPNDAVVGAGDPMRSAAAAVSTAFASPRRLEGRPAEAARCIAQMEFLAIELPNSPQLNRQNPTVGAQFATARQEWRSALGIAPDAPAQPIINALYAAARALDAGDSLAAARALPPEIFTAGGGVTIARLADLPRLPQTNVAATQALQTIQNQDPSPGRSL